MKTKYRPCSAKIWTKGQEPVVVHCLVHPDVTDIAARRKLIVWAAEVLGVGQKEIRIKLEKRVVSVGDTPLKISKEGCRRDWPFKIGKEVSGIFRTRVAEEDENSGRVVIEILSREGEYRTRGRRIVFRLQEGLIPEWEGFYLMEKYVLRPERGGVLRFFKINV